MSEERLLSWPTTGQSAERVLQPFGARCAGTGFYSADHRKPRAKEPPTVGDA
jgi:predicted nucleic acid-binding Zn ribbon protein